MRARMAASASARWTARVYANALAQIVTYQSLYRQPGLHRQFDRIRQVIFAFFGKRDPAQGLPQPVSGEAVRTHIQLLDSQLLRRGSGLFNNRLHMPVRIPDNPPKPARIGSDDGQHGHRAGIFLLGLNQARQGLRTQKRHIRIGDQHQVRFAPQGGFGLLDGMPGAQRRVLENNLGGISQKSPQGLAILADYDHRLFGTGRAGNRKGIGKHGFSADRVQHFQ